MYHVECDCKCHNSPLVKEGGYCYWCSPAHKAIEIIEDKK